MPTGACHSFFWASQEAETPPQTPTSAGVVSYPRWQTTIILGSGFGVFQAVYERWRPVTTTTMSR